MLKLRMRSMWVMAVAAVLLLSACVESKIFKKSEIIQHQLEQQYSVVYFLREDTGLIRGLPDDKVLIDINGHNLVRLAIGEYVMFRIKPIEATVRISSYDIAGKDPYPREMFGEDTFNFVAGQTNFIRVKMIDAEFRGTYFEPERVESFVAREISKKLRPAGEAAENPISDL